MPIEGEASAPQLTKPDNTLEVLDVAGRLIREQAEAERIVAKGWHDWIKGFIPYDEIPEEKRGGLLRINIGNILTVGQTGEFGSSTVGPDGVMRDQTSNIYSVTFRVGVTEFKCDSAKYDDVVNPPYFTRATPDGKENSITAIEFMQALHDRITIQVENAKRATLSLEGVQGMMPSTSAPETAEPASHAPGGE